VPRATPALAAILVLAPALAAIFVLAGCDRGRDEGPASGGIGAVYDPPRPAPRLHLSGAGGVFDLSQERGHAVLVFFGFTRCPDVCPETLARWAKVRAALGADSGRVRFVFVSVDPDHDTPAIAAEYARTFHPSFLGLSGSAAEVGEVALAWGVAAKPAATAGATPDSGIQVVHTAQVFVVDGEGLLRWSYGRSATVEEIAAGVRGILGTRG
jgi:protein SCO1/2